MEQAIPLNLTVTGRDGPVLNGVVKLSTGSANDPDRDADTSDDGTVILSTSAPQFDIIDAGTYRLEVTGEGDVDFSLSAVDATVLANAPIAENRFKIPGFALIAFGIIMMVRAAKKRRKDRKRKRKTSRRKQDRSAQQELPKPERKKTPPPPSDEEPAEPKRRKIQWGRNASDK